MEKIGIWRTRSAKLSYMFWTHWKASASLRTEPRRNVDCERKQSASASAKKKKDEDRGRSPKNGFADFTPKRNFGASASDCVNISPRARVCITGPRWEEFLTMLNAAG